MPLQLNATVGDSLSTLAGDNGCSTSTPRCSPSHHSTSSCGSLQAATVLCTCVFDGNMPLVKRYLAAGVPIDAGDYDLRTALHISAAEGNLTAVRSW